MNGQFTIKYFIFRIIWKIPCVVQISPVLYLNSLCFPCLEKVITKFRFPCADLYSFGKEVQKCANLVFTGKAQKNLVPPPWERNVVRMGYPYQNLSPYMEPRIRLGLAHWVRKSAWKLQISTSKKAGKHRFHISWTFRSFFKGKTVLGVLLRTFYGLHRVFSSKPSLSYSPMAILVILQDLGVHMGMT